MQCHNHPGQPALECCAECGKPFCGDCLKEAAGRKQCPECASASEQAPAAAISEHICKNHPEVHAVDRCSGCQEAFCRNCLVDVNSQLYCEGCKVMAIPKGATPEALCRPSEDAKQSLTYALIGLLCFGVILGPMAVHGGLKARQKIKGNKLLTGYGKANAAIVIGGSVFLLWLFNMIVRFQEVMRP